MNERLKWILSQVVKLDADNNVRYEGNGIYQGLKMELESVIDGYEAAMAQWAKVATPTVVEQVVMTADQVAEVIASIPKVGNYESVLAGLTETVHSALEASDVAVMAAINAKGDDIVAALKAA
ncbi:hypothetical protein [Duganella violaceipulchra]|uniref:Uncharacterized protein n=1 Tax=Duganella violaceipulchra TaxID=2849652 RepID=A0AA41L185_9BURK|nr:hypothetical protein [Duganella violaceicalia]MBV6324371.1 hypothetical protein [Duganella violaceicalia]MCP2007235.1 hypothetical protein [Duganella violaceicalia]